MLTLFYNISCIVFINRITNLDFTIINTNPKKKKKKTIKSNQSSS